MEIYRVQQSDLIGQLEGFPIEVVQKMVERQYEQTGICDVRVFQRDPANGVSWGGFNWGETVEDYCFWNYVIRYKEFNRFFGVYPKQEVQVQQEEDYWIKPEGVRMLVWDDNEKWAKERIVIAKLPKNTAFPYVTVDYDYEEYFEKGKEYHTSRYKNTKPLPKQTELTMQEIADKFGLKVDEIKIV